MATVGRVRDADILAAALLHDTIEDTETSLEEIDQAFGERVRRIVQEVTDDKSLPKAERKRLQIEHARHLSSDAVAVKLADKIANIDDITQLDSPTGGLCSLSSIQTGVPTVPGSSTRNFRFAEFELHREARELTRNGKRIRLQIQPFRVLELFLERAGEVVTREEFRTRVWPSNVYVDFDHGLNNAITRLREALGDHTDNPRYIETLHRVGYRFIYPLSSEATDTVLPDAEQSDVPAPVTARSRPLPRLLAIGAAVFAIAVFGTLIAIDRSANQVGANPIRSIAVLQFRDPSKDGGEDYFAAGMTEALITRLAHSRDLRVVSRRAATRHQDPERPIAEIGRELQVDGVIDGSIVRQGNGVRVDVRLVRAADESHAWAQSYDRSMQDVFELQRELADDIGSEIDAGVRGKPDEQVSVAGSDNVKAYEIYLQGRHLWKQRNRESIDNSVEYFQTAIQLDPDFAAAHAGLAQAYATLGGNTLVKSTPAAELRSAAMAAARRAIVRAGRRRRTASHAEFAPHRERQRARASRPDPARSSVGDRERVWERP